MKELGADSDMSLITRLASLESHFLDSSFFFLDFDDGRFCCSECVFLVLPFLRLVLLRCRSFLPLMTVLDLSLDH